MNQNMGPGLPPERRAMIDRPLTTSSRDITVEPSLGIHGRIITRLIQAAEKYPDTAIILQRGKDIASCASAMQLALLAASCGEKLAVKADGPQAAEALEAVTDILSHEEISLESEIKAARLAQRETARRFLEQVRADKAFSRSLLSFALKRVPELINALEELIDPQNEADLRLLAAIRQEMSVPEWKTRTPEEASGILSKSIEASPDRLALFGLHSENQRFVFAGVPYAAIREVSIKYEAGGFYYSGPTGMYCGMHAWDLVVLEDDSDRETGALRACGFEKIKDKENGGDRGRSDTEWQLDARVVQDGAAELARMSSDSWLRGTLSERPDSPAGFIRLDPPSNSESFLKLKLHKNSLTEEDKERLQELLAAEYKGAAAFLGRAVNNDKLFVMTKTARILTGLDIPPSLTLREFINRIGSLRQPDKS